jgi:hypothetical protein
MGEDDFSHTRASLKDLFKSALGRKGIRCLKTINCIEQFFYMIQILNLGRINTKHNLLNDSAIGMPFNKCYILILFLRYLNILHIHL